MHTENVAGSLMVLPALVKLRILFAVVAVLSAIPVSAASNFREGDILILSENRSFLSRFQDQGILLLYELRNQRECGDVRYQKYSQCRSSYSKVCKKEIPFTLFEIGLRKGLFQKKWDICCSTFQESSK